MQQLKFLQFIRAYAALSVVYLHLNTEFSFGHFGVDLFFVLSGYVIAMIISHNQKPFPFLISRLTRIAPLYWLFTVFLFIAVYFKPNYFQGTFISLEYLIKSLLFIPYFNPNGAVLPIFTLGWTLVYEMLFYLCTFFVLCLNIKKPLIVIVFLIGLCPILGTYVNGSNPFVAFLKEPIIIEFVFGIIAFKINNNFKTASHTLKIVFSMFIPLILFFMIYIKNDYLAFRHLYFGITSFLVITMVFYLEEWINELPKKLSSFFVLLGDSSYALYLSHIFVISIMRKVIAPQLPLLAPSVPFGAFITMILSIIVALGVYKFIDKPLTTKMRQLLTRRV